MVDPEVADHGAPHQRQALWGVGVRYVLCHRLKRLRLPIDWEPALEAVIPHIQQEAGHRMVQVFGVGVPNNPQRAATAGNSDSEDLSVEAQSLRCQTLTPGNSLTCPEGLGFAEIVIASM